MFCRVAAFSMALVSLGIPARAADAPASQWKYDNPFCDAVAAVAPLPDVVASLTLATAESRYAVDLQARTGTTLAAHVTLVSDTDAYDAAVPRTSLSGAAADRETPAFIVALPKPDRIKFYFVDQYAVDGGASVTCPSYVFPIGEPLASQGSAAVLTATHLQSLGMVPCGAVYRPVRFGNDFGSLIGAYGNKRLSVSYHAYVDSNGRALRETLLQSSGVAGLDAAALGEIQQGDFKPAQFLCTPVVGEIDVELDYVP
jgi:hypothetical protein